MSNFEEWDIDTLRVRYKELEELNKGLIESNKEWLKHYSILETESEILKSENEQYKKQFEDIKCNILVPSITEKNFISISVIQNKKSKLDEEDLEIYETDSEDLRIAKYEQRAVLDFCNSLLEERNK